MELNPAQRRAVDHRGGPLLVLAGAGTGKTRVITHRVASVLGEGVEPWRVLAVTFTNKAAQEMRERIRVLCESDPALADVDPRELWVGTFHSIAARILRRFGEPVGLSPRFSIYDTADQKSLMRAILKEQKVDPRRHPVNSFLGAIDRAKNRGLSHSDRDLADLGLSDPVHGLVQRAWREYERRLRLADAADFGDLLILAVRLLAGEGGANAPLGAGEQLGGLDPVARLRRRFQHVVVDEYQDTNRVQAELVALLSGSAELCVVGDDDQAIYGWRGADVSQILDFPREHAGCEVIRLEQNYRSTGYILDCADGIIRRNLDRLGKRLWTDAGEGERVRVVRLTDERDEARFVAAAIARACWDEGATGDEFAVFYRTHAQSRALEEAMRRADVHYRLVGGIRFFDRAEIKDLVAYMRLMISPGSDVDVVRIINRPTRGIGAKTLARLQARAANEGISLYDATADPKAAGIGPAATRKVLGFRALMESLTERVGTLPLDELASVVLEETGLREVLAAEDTEESQARLENLQEFVGALAEFVDEEPASSLADYLEQVSLSTTDDESSDGAAVTMMTVHSAKGLEFDRVFLTGMEESVFPHARSIDDPVQLEEERRLAYVAVTRARRELTLTFAARRYLFGSDQINPPSRFVGDLPVDAVEEIGVARPRRRAGGGGARGRLAFRSGARVGAALEDELPDDPVPDPEPRWDDDIELDPEYASTATPGLQVYVGMSVRHPRFGVGDVAGWSGSGAQMKLVIRFPQHGSKTILARYCEPI